MTREEVLALIRDHLADELEIDPSAINEGTRFKEDLEADSLDLYTLVQELEDSYGVKMSDEQAAQILTVARPSTRPRPRPERRRIAAPQGSDGRAPRGPVPAGVHARIVDRAAQRLLFPPGLPG